MSLSGWGALLAKVDSEQEPPSNPSGSSALASSTADGASTDQPHAAPAVGWGSLLAQPSAPALRTGQHTEVADPYAEEENIDLASFAPPPSKRKGRPHAVLASLPSLPSMPAAWYPSPGGDTVARGVGDNLGSSLHLPLQHILGVDPGQGLQIPAPPSFIRPAVQGLRLPSLCAAGVANSVTEADRHPNQLDNAYSRLFEHYIQDSKHHNASAQVRAELLSMSTFQLNNKVLRLAASQTLWGRLSQATLEHHLASTLQPADLVAYLEFLSYDETPMKTAVVDSTALAETAVFTDDGQASSVPAAGATCQLKTDGASSKVLQCKQRYAMVVKISGKFTRIVGDVPSPLSVMQQGTAEVLTESLQRLSTSTVASQKFPIQTCIFSSDKAPYNPLG